MRRLLLALFRHQTLYMVREDLRFWRVRVRPQRHRKLHARFLNAGCGASGVQSSEWLNVDASPAPGVDLLCDLTRPLPLAAGQFAGIFCEHFLEHLTAREARVFLAECRRVLRPGGVIRLIVPDGELYVRNYRDDPAWVVAQRDGGTRTPMEVLNHVFRQEYQHQYTYDYETLSLRLREAGFTDVRREAFGVGRVPELLIDLPSRAVESLYVEAEAPPR